MDILHAGCAWVKTEKQTNMDSLKMNFKGCCFTFLIYFLHCWFTALAKDSRQA